MQLIDFDSLFQEKLGSYIQKHKGEFTEGEWEDKIVELYQQFIEMPLESIQNSPREYFRQKGTTELVALLKAYVTENIVVPDVLLDALAKTGYNLEIAALLVEENEVLQNYAIDLLQADKRIIQSYFYILKNRQYSVAVKVNIATQLEKVATKLIQPLYKLLHTDGQEYAIELLIKAGERTEKLYNTVVEGYRMAENKLLYLKFLGDLGDTRALEFLYNDIANEEIGYILFKEMKYTIEKLGGSYDILRNFSLDEDYKRIQLANKMEEELRKQKQTEGQNNG